MSMQVNRVVSQLQSLPLVLPTTGLATRTWNDEILRGDFCVLRLKALKKSSL